jgi:nitroreductase
MEFFEVIKERRSIRAYRPQPIEPRALEKILETSRRAPSAGNLQAYEIYVVDEEQGKSALTAAALGQEFIGQAPVVLVFCAHADRSSGKYGRRGVDLYCLQDATIACTFAMLAATALGLSSVWVGAFDEGQVRKILHTPPSHRPLVILPLGYAAESPPETERRNLEGMIHHVQRKGR